MRPVYSIDEVRAAEAEYLKSGEFSIAELVGRAASALLREIKNRFSKNTSVCIAAGKGMNGEDGKALFPMLVRSGFSVRLFDLTLEGPSGSEIDAQAFDGYGVIVDAVFGTGFRGKADGVFLKAIESINAAKGPDGTKAFVLSADVPSGLNADNGIAEGAAVYADLTVTFGGMKKGLILNDGFDHTGEIVVGDIGVSFPPGWIFETEESDIVLPKRKRNTHKGDYGRLVIIAGSAEMPGAAVIAASSAARTGAGLYPVSRAAGRTGAGLVTLAVPGSMSAAFQSRITEATLFFLPDKNGKIAFDEKRMNVLFERADAAVIGPGLSDNPELERILSWLFGRGVPLLIDADALNCLAKNLSLLDSKKSPVVLTPHPKEFERLSGVSVGEQKRDPIGCALAFSRKHGVITVLKGAATVIADGRTGGGTAIPGEVWELPAESGKDFPPYDGQNADSSFLKTRPCAVINTAGTPALAKGGSGDLLSGVIGALMCRFDPFVSAVYGAYIFGGAAQKAAAVFGENSLLASDIPDFIRL